MSYCSLFGLKHIVSNFDHHAFEKDLQKLEKSPRKMTEAIKIMENGSNKKILCPEKQG